MCANSNIDVTVTHNLVTPSCNHSVDFLMQVIRSNQYKMKVEIIRQMVLTGFIEEANELKKSLPGATFSCRYDKRRCAENVKGYTGIMVLDADKLDIISLLRIATRLRSCPWVYGFFISPSGNGLKILIKTNGSKENHKETYQEVTRFFSKMLKVKFDPSCSDIVRLCFMSYDPDAYFNPDAWTFIVEQVEKKTPTPILAKHLSELGCESSDYVFRKCVRFTNRRRTFIEGNRNNFIFLLSCYCRMNGLSLEATTDEILKHYNFNQKEITSTVKSAYRYK